MRIHNTDIMPDEEKGKESLILYGTQKKCVTGTSTRDLFICDPKSFIFMRFHPNHYDEKQPVI